MRNLSEYWKVGVMPTPPPATGSYFDSSRVCEPLSATAPLMCLSMALRLSAWLWLWFSKIRATWLLSPPGWDAWAAADGRLMDRKVYGFDVGIKGGITSSDWSPRRASMKPLCRWPRGLDFSHPVDSLLI